MREDHIEISKNRAICARCGGRNGHSSCVFINEMTCTTACGSSFSSSAMLAVLTSREMEVLLFPYYAAKYREKNPLPESLQPPCDSPPCAPDILERSERLRERGNLKRSLSQDEISRKESVVLLSECRLPQASRCDNRFAKRRGVQAQASRRWEAMGHTQRRQLGSIQGEGVDSKRRERNV